MVEFRDFGQAISRQAARDHDSKVFAQSKPSIDHRLHQPQCQRDGRHACGPCGRSPLSTTCHGNWSSAETIPKSILDRQVLPHPVRELSKFFVEHTRQIDEDFDNGEPQVLQVRQHYHANEFGFTAVLLSLGPDWQNLAKPRCVARGCFPNIADLSSFRSLTVGHVGVAVQNSIVSSSRCLVLAFGLPRPMLLAKRARSNRVPIPYSFLPNLYVFSRHSEREHLETQRHRASDLFMCFNSRILMGENHGLF